MKCSMWHPILTGKEALEELTSHSLLQYMMCTLSLYGVYMEFRSSWQNLEKKYLFRVTQTLLFRNSLRHNLPEAGGIFPGSIATCWPSFPRHSVGKWDGWSHPVEPYPHCLTHVNAHLWRTIPVTQVINWWAQSIRQPPSLRCASAIPVITNSNPQTVLQWRLRAETRWTPL